MKRLSLLAVLVATPLAAQVPSLTRVGEIGCTDCGSAAQFAEIMDVAVTNSGDVLVVANEAPTLRMFDRSGKLLWTSGRQGTGPGEYRLAIRAAIGPDVIQVVDMTQRRITRLTRSGRVTGTVPVNGFSPAVGVRGSTGEMVLLIDDYRGTFAFRRVATTDSGSVIGTMSQPIAASIPSMAVDPAGGIAVLRNPNEYLIVRLAPDGQPVGEIRRDIERVSRTPAEIAAIERRRAAAADRAKRNAERGQSGASPPLFSRPVDELKPHLALAGLRYDDTGRLWAKTMRGNESSTIFDLFAPDGRYLSEVKVPAAIGMFSLMGRWFVADFESDDGTPRIGVWQVR